MAKLKIDREDDYKSWHSIMQMNSGMQAEEKAKTPSPDTELRSAKRMPERPKLEFIEALRLASFLEWLNNLEKENS